MAPAEVHHEFLASSYYENSKFYILLYQMVGPTLIGLRVGEGIEKIAPYIFDQV